MVRTCGGGIPRFGTRWNPRKQKAVRSYYRAKGFTTKKRSWSGAQHCAHPMGAPTIAWFTTH